jgi:hypothetical protein
MVCDYAVGRNGFTANSIRVLFPFCRVALWLAPMLVFYARKSFWAVAMAVILARLGARLIHNHHNEIEGRESPSSGLGDGSMSPGLVATISLASCIQVAAGCVVASLARPASILLGACIVLLTWFWEEAVNRRPENPPWRTVRSLCMAALAIAFTAAGLTPYLAVASDPEGPGKPAGTATNGLDPDSHALLQTLFGVASTNDSHSSRELLRGKMISIAPGVSYSGMLLRPPIEERAAISPPVPSRRIFGGKPTERRTEPVSIPFFGTYWFFRSADKTLPADAAESRGDPASTSFRTTDFTPITMEARQNFGRLIDLGCCRAIQVVINNGDRRPGTVSLELVLVNNRLTGHSTQSLGAIPVNSPLRWQSNDGRPPVEQVLTFRIPAQAAIREFDEAIIRFQLSSPRRSWSAKIAIDRFRLIPRGL